jgi:hypothetical protein
MLHHIEIVEKINIDVEKWNGCINKNKGLIYCRYDYLSIMSINWVGIIINDYEAVMPICYQKKWGIKYSFTPPFIQQLGLVAHSDFFLNEDLMKKIKQTISLLFSYGDIHFNYKNIELGKEGVIKNNYIISLNQQFNTIQKNFITNAKKNIAIAEKKLLRYEKEVQLTHAINLYSKFLIDKNLKIPSPFLERFVELCSNLQHKNMCFTRGVSDKSNDLLTVGIFFKDENRIYNMVSVTTSIGRKLNSNYLLISKVLEEFSDNPNLVFDFEGSDLDGVKEFYQKFGAINQPYFHWHFNNLPFYIKWLKK